MKKYLFLTIMAAGLGLTLLSCSNDNEPQAVQSEICFGSNIGGMTRSNEATNLLSGDTVYVWADMVNATDGTQTEYFKAWALTADGVGGLTPMSGDTKLFPATNNLNFYSLVGNFGKDGNGDPVINPEIVEEEDKMALPATGIIHTVLGDQREAEDYYKSDLLYAVVKNQAPISQAVVLPFQHMLSRIQVVLVAGNGMTTDELGSATVKLLNLKRQVTFRPDSTKSVAISNDAVVHAASRANLAGMLSIPMSAQQSDILMKTEVVSKVADITASVYADAIVVPKQTIPAESAFIEVDYLDRQTYYKLPADFTIESGRQYRFNLICDRIGEIYELNTVTVEDWGLAGTALPLWLDTEVK